MGEQRRLDTVVVPPVNDVDAITGVCVSSARERIEIRVFGLWGSMVASLKLKGIDGRAQPGVEPAA